MQSIFKKISGFDRRAETDDDLEALEEEYNEEIAETAASTADEEEKKWMASDYEEGQLSIDVYQTPDTLVIKSTIAGVKPEDIDISINNDLLTIRGSREMVENIREENYLYRECYWGSFSRSIILPVEVEADKIEAFLENGVLTVILPKARSAKQISIKVKER
jgi:HSP20 family molecular chaperone IbpA